MSIETLTTSKNAGTTHVARSAFVLGSLVCIFFLPRFVPVAPSISHSYFVGYSNRAGVLFLLACLVLGGYFCRSLSIQPRGASLNEPVAQKKVWAWMGIFSVGWALVFLLARGLGGFAESIYLVDRVKMLASGGMPYRDFEYAYGAIFLYGPRALMTLHLSAEDSYYIFWLMTLLAGVWMLAGVLNLLEYPGARKSEAFSLLCLCALPAVLSAGVNYTLFRFLPAAYLGLLVQRVDADEGEKRNLQAMFLAVGSTILLLLLSAEIALSFAAGVIGYFGFFGFRKGSFKESRFWGRFVLFLSLELGVLYEAGRLGLFEAVKAFGGGAYNFPIVPAGHILFFFFCCGVVALYAAGRLRAGAQGGAMLMVLAISVASLFAALGRCDVWHVSFAGIGVMVVATLLISSMPKLWPGFRVGFVVLFIALPAMTALYWYQAALVSRVAFLRWSRLEPDSALTVKLNGMAEQYFERKAGTAAGRLKADVLKASSRVPAQINLQTTYPGASEVLEAPFGYKPNQLGEYHAPAVHTGYYLGLLNAFTKSAVLTKVNELRAHPDRDLLLPDDFRDECQVHPAAERRTLRIVFMSPIFPEVRHSDSVWQPLCDFITADYSMIQPAEAGDFGYEVWRLSRDRDR